MRLPLVGIAVLMAVGGCLVDQRCESSEDCPSSKVCSQQGRCVWECTTAEECGPGFTCEGHLCVPAEIQEIVCPPDMVKVGDIFCIDRHEASRPDATTESAGLDETVAVSRPGVLPWTLDDNNPVADAACAAAGKRLCTSFEWELACRGPAMTVYGYGNSYDEKICNGIDTFGPSGVKLLPTGAFEECVNGWGAYDMNGNLWEHVAGGDGTKVRGGAYNCIDSMSLHRCDYVPRTWVPSALGFRCCLTPEGAVRPGDVREEPDAGMLDLPETSDGPGCLDPDLGPSLDIHIEATLTDCVVDAQCLHLLTGESQCLEAVCLEGGKCALQPSLDGTSCEDGDPCSVGEECLEGQCESGTETLDCDDDNPCTDDDCVPFSGCQVTPNSDSCDDDNPCTEPDVCEGGECVSGEVVCLCEQDVDCPQDDNLCNGTLVCNKGVFPFECIVDEQTVVVCEQPADPCFMTECQPASGFCVDSASPEGTPCDDGDICNGPDQCLAGVCVPGVENLCLCPDDMVSVDDDFCLDRYEASRPDATAQFKGYDLSIATSRPDVIPWFPVEYATAKVACEAAGKRLCTEAEIVLACGGPEGWTYLYGNEYSATICNGIDAFCFCDAEACAGLEECPYPHCYSTSSEGVYGEGCGAAFHVAPTGSFEQCVNQWGAYDINGNVWELVDTGNEESWYKGGAYNCGNSEMLHQCQGMFQSISAKGFRCCRNIQQI